MLPESRVATERSSNFGDDLKLSKHRILGSVGRNALLNKAFTQYLISNQLVEVDEFPLISYHFSRPWNSEKLAELGIQYAVQNSTILELYQDNWPVVASAYQDHVFLRKNPQPVVFKRSGGPGHLFRSRALKSRDH